MELRAATQNGTESPEEEYMSSGKSTRVIEVSSFAFDIANAKVVVGRLTRGENVANVFAEMPLTDFEDLVKGKQTLSVNYAQANLGYWAGRIAAFNKAGNQLSLHSDPLSTAYVEDEKHLATLLMNAVPQKGTRLVVICKFSVGEISNLKPDVWARMVAHASDRAITVAELNA
jgi:hypothetical protein